MNSMKFNSVTLDGLLLETLPSVSHGEGPISIYGRLQLLDAEDLVYVDKREVARNLSVLAGSVEHLRVSRDNFGWRNECLEKETSVELRALSRRTFFISRGEEMVCTDSVISSAECLKLNPIFEKL